VGTVATNLKVIWEMTAKAAHRKQPKSRRRHPISCIGRIILINIGVISMRKAFTIIGAVIVLWQTPGTVTAQPAFSDVSMHKQCPDGWIWNKTRKKCVRVPRGSFY
jgi:hypothetical protein